MTKKILYKSMPANMICHGHKYEVGKWYKIKGEIEICKNGFHASKNILDAMGYVNAEIIAKVKTRGKSIVQDDKECWSEIKILKTYKWTRKDSISLAIFAAELCIDNFERVYPDDDRPRRAIPNSYL